MSCPLCRKVISWCRNPGYSATFIDRTQQETNGPRETMSGTHKMKRARTRSRVLRSHVIRLMNDANEQRQPESSASARELGAHIDRLQELQRMLAEVNDQLNDLWQDEQYGSKIISALKYSDQLASCITKWKGQRYFPQVFAVSHRSQSMDDS